MKPKVYSHEKRKEIIGKRLVQLEKNYEVALRNEYKELKRQLPSADIICYLINRFGIHGRPTTFVYSAYVTSCSFFGIKPMNKITFSKFVIEEFDYFLANRKRNGKKYRVFFKKQNPS